MTGRQNRADSSAGEDKATGRRAERDTEGKDAQLDEALDQSMDAPDPPAATQPGRGRDPAPAPVQDGMKEAAERAGP